MIGIFDIDKLTLPRFFALYGMLLHILVLTLHMGVIAPGAQNADEAGTSSFFSNVVFCLNSASSRAGNASSSEGEPTTPPCCADCLSHCASVFGPLLLLLTFWLMMGLRARSWFAAHVRLPDVRRILRPACRGPPIFA